MTRCPKCASEIPAPETTGESRPTREPAPGRGEPAKPGREAAGTPEETLRADTPPAPCPQCGWSTMWNE